MIDFHNVRSLLGLLRPRSADAPVLRPVIDEATVAWPFTEAAVDLMPAGPGVFFLYASGRLIYIGVALNGVGIREELASHLRGAHGVRTRDATAFVCEASSQPLKLQRAYLEAHRARYGGRVPPCNEGELGPG